MNDSYYDPPEDPDISPEAENIAVKLEAAGVEQAMIDEIINLIETLHANTNQECPACERRAAETEIAADKAALDWLQEMSERADEETSLCPHEQQRQECNACLEDSDMAYDIDREKRHFGR